MGLDAPVALLVKMVGSSRRPRSSGSRLMPSAYRGALRLPAWPGRLRFSDLGSRQRKLGSRSDSRCRYVSMSKSSRASFGNTVGRAGGGCGGVEVVMARGPVRGLRVRACVRACACCVRCVLRSCVRSCVQARTVRACVASRSSQLMLARVARVARVARAEAAVAARTNQSARTAAGATQARLPLRRVVAPMAAA